MRIIAGQARGLRLQVPKGDVRPTTDRVRESLFSILGSRVDGASVLDLFAGSGSLGLEALSRGAASVTFVDTHRPTCHVIEANLASTRLGPAQVKCRDVTAFLRTAGDVRFDLIFIDPPYPQRPGDPDLGLDLLHHPRLAEILASTGCVVWETPTGRSWLDDIPPWDLIDQRAYGKTTLCFLQIAGA